MGGETHKSGCRSSLYDHAYWNEVKVHHVLHLREDMRISNLLAEDNSRKTASHSWKHIQILLHNSGLPSRLCAFFRERIYKNY